jgi:F0F1-type ATP synthase beta subunit
MLQTWNECVDTGSALNVPVGKTTLGRIFNVLGEVVDGLEEVNAEQRLSATVNRTKTDNFRHGMMNP